MSDEFAPTTAGGSTCGPWRIPRNAGASTKGNIHSDEDAQKLGFRGGLVAGSIHMEMFPPILRHHFGNAWFERGSLSLMFLNATINGEQVRAAIETPTATADTQVAAWGEQPDGTRIAEGTAAVGDPGETSALRTRDLLRHPPQEIRLLERVNVGDDFPEVEVRVRDERQAERGKVITEPLDWYWNDSPWGAPIATPVTFVEAIRASSNAYLRNVRADAIGLFGAIEIRNVNGPMLTGTTYKGGGKVLAVGDSPKTEFLWFDCWADDDAGTRVSEMRMMLRFVKASSKLYSETPAATAARPE